MSAKRILLTEIVDYAGLFPPAALPFPRVLENFALYGESEKFSWMLGRLVMPVGKLMELENSPTFRDRSRLWKISCLIPTFSNENDDLERAVAEILAFNQRHEGSALIDAVEVKAPNVATLKGIDQLVSDAFATYCEIPNGENPEDFIQSIKGSSNPLFAKIRCGGITPDLIPTAQQICRFISICASHRVGFKATAGLHHPLCGDYRLTYDEEANTAKMFGFFNVFVASCFAFNGKNELPWLLNILTDSNPENFRLDDRGLRWCEWSCDREQIKLARQEFAISFGSCSFTEPTKEFERAFAQSVESSN